MWSPRWRRRWTRRATRRRHGRTSRKHRQRMQFNQGIVTHNVTPLRASPDGDSEQVSQAILGDVIALLEERDGWARVQTADAYEGWIRRWHVRPLPLQDPPTPLWPFDDRPEDAHRVISGFADLIDVCGDPSTL